MPRRPPPPIALSNRRLESRARTAWRAHFERDPEPKELAALVVLARVVEGDVRRQAQAEGNFLLRTTERAIGPDRNDPETCAAALALLAFGKFSRDPMDSVRRSLRARDRLTARLPKRKERSP